MRQTCGRRLRPGPNSPKAPTGVRNDRIKETAAHLPGHPGQDLAAGRGGAVGGAVGRCVRRGGVSQRPGLGSQFEFHPQGDRIKSGAAAAGGKAGRLRLPAGGGPSPPPTPGSNNTEVLMPTNTQKPSSNSKDTSSKKPATGSELSDDDLRSISGGMTAKPGVSGGTDPVCISSTSSG